MVVIGIVLWVFGMQLLGQLFIGMGLNGQGFCDGENLEEERQLLAITGDRGRSEEEVVVFNEVKESTARLEVFGWIGRMSAHPELLGFQESVSRVDRNGSYQGATKHKQAYLSVGLVIFDGEVVGRCCCSKSGSSRVRALLAPIVRIDSTLEPDQGHLHDAGRAVFVGGEYSRFARGERVCGEADDNGETQDENWQECKAGIQRHSIIPR